MSQSQSKLFHKSIKAIYMHKVKKRLRYKNIYSCIGNTKLVVDASVDFLEYFILDCFSFYCCQKQTPKSLNVFCDWLVFHENDNMSTLLDIEIKWFSLFLSTISRARRPMIWRLIWYISISHYLVYTFFAFIKTLICDKFVGCCFY